eukprot:COSAG02_NODE_1958_length_10261_cov_16.118973_6_plen_52_part_00
MGVGVGVVGVVSGRGEEAVRRPAGGVRSSRAVDRPGLEYTLHSTALLLNYM